VALGMDELVRAGLDPTRECSGSISLLVPNGRPATALLVEYHLTLSFGEPLLFYSLREGGQTGQVRLQKTIHYRGGAHWWFTCPSPSTQWCNRRVGRLYLPPGGVYFGCRECHRLTYWSVQTHDNRVRYYREHPEKLLAVMNSALDPSALSKRRLAFKALGLVK
jgi:hypothetical protein